MSEKTNLLLSLSLACKKHKHKLHSSGVLEEQEQSKDCRNQLQMLRSLIPKVEAQAVRSVDIAHLCDFYTDVFKAEDGFCPHAAQIFRSGDGGTDSKFSIFVVYYHYWHHPMLTPFSSSSLSTSILSVRTSNFEAIHSSILQIATLGRKNCLHCGAPSELWSEAPTEHPAGPDQFVFWPKHRSRSETSQCQCSCCPTGAVFRNGRN